MTARLAGPCRQVWTSAWFLLPAGELFPPAQVICLQTGRAGARPVQGCRVPPCTEMSTNDFSKSIAPDWSGKYIHAWGNAVLGLEKRVANGVSHRRDAARLSWPVGSDPTGLPAVCVAVPTKVASRSMGRTFRPKAIQLPSDQHVAVPACSRAPTVCSTCARRSGVLVDQRPVGEIDGAWLPRPK